MSNASADTTVYSRVQDLEARPDGLWAKLHPWDADFSKLPKGLGISPRWIALPNASEPDVFEPVKMISIGLWTTPKIPGTSLVNGDLDPVATPTSEAPVERRISDPEKLNLTNENVALKSQIAALNSTIATISGERDEWKSRSERASREADAKWTEANAFKAAMASLLAREYVSFRNAITPAEEPALVASLVNAVNPDALDSILAPLRSKAVSLPNAHSAAAQVGDRKANPDAGAAQAEFKAKVAELEATGLSYSDAWAKSSTSHATLFKSAYPNG
jgi:cytochrome c556